MIIKSHKEILEIKNQSHNRTLACIKQKLIELKREPDKSINKIRNFNTSLSVINK